MKAAVLIALVTALQAQAAACSTPDPSRDHSAFATFAHRSHRARPTRTPVDRLGLSLVDTARPPVSTPEETGPPQDEPAPEATEPGGGKEEDEKTHWGKRATEGLLVFIQTFGILIIFAVVLFSKKASAKRARERTTALAAAVDGTAMRIDDDPESFRATLPDLPLLSRGRGHRLTNLIRTDTPGVDIGTFDYRFVTGSGKNRRVRTVTAAYAISTHLDPPTCTLRPESRILDSIGALLGMQDIDFDDHPEFSRAFVLKADDEEAARRFFDRGVLDFFAARPDVCFEARPGAFLFYRKWDRIEPHLDAVRSLMDEAITLFGEVQRRQAGA